MDTLLTTLLYRRTKLASLPWAQLHSTTSVVSHPNTLSSFSLSLSFFFLSFDSVVYQSLDWDLTPRLFFFFFFFVFLFYTSTGEPPPFSWCRPIELWPRTHARHVCCCYSWPMWWPARSCDTNEEMAWPRHSTIRTAIPSPR